MQNFNSKKIIENLERIDRAQLELYFKNNCMREQFIKNLIDTIDSGLIVINEVGEVLFSNKNIYDVLGINSEKLSGKILYDYVHDSNLRDILKNLIQNGVLSGQAHVNYPRPLHLSINIFPILAEQAFFIEDLKLVIIRDTTQDINEAEYREHTAKLEALKLLTAGIAHEIGNPLSSISLHTQLAERLLKKMEETENTQNLKNMLNIIAEENSRLKRIIDNFLKAVRPISLQLVLGKLSNTLDDVLALMKPELQQKNIDIKKHYENVSQTLLDQDQMHSVFINVIKNSMDAMPDGGTLTVTLKQHGNWQIISLKDNGIGMDREILKHVFKPYYTTKTDGSGLGMLIMQRIIHAHSGLLSIKSEKHYGTEIIIELPIRSTAAPQSLPDPNQRRDS